MWEAWVQSLGQEYPLEKGIFQYSTPVFFPGEFYGQRSLAGCNPRDHKQYVTNSIAVYEIEKHRSLPQSLRNSSFLISLLYFPLTSIHVFPSKRASTLKCTLTLEV